MAAESLSHLQHLTPRGLQPAGLFRPRDSPSMGLSRPQDWGGLPFPSPGDPPNPGVAPRSPALQADSLPSESPGEAIKFSTTQFFTWFPEVKFSLSRTKKKMPMSSKTCSSPVLSSEMSSTCSRVRKTVCLCWV